MKRNVAFRAEAEVDLDKILEYIARDSPRNAIEYVRRVRDYCERLGDFPERGTRRDDLGPGLRLIGFQRRVAILFRVLPDRVQIVAISYGGRDIEQVMRERGLG